MVLVYVLLSNWSAYTVEVKKSLKLLVTVYSKIKNSFFWERKIVGKTEGVGSQAMWANLNAGYHPKGPSCSPWDCFFPPSPWCLNSCISIFKVWYLIWYLTTSSSSSAQAECGGKHYSLSATRGALAAVAHLFPFDFLAILCPLWQNKHYWPRTWHGIRYTLFQLLLCSDENWTEYPLLHLLIHNPTGLIFPGWREEDDTRKEIRIMPCVIFQGDC